MQVIRYHYIPIAMNTLLDGQVALHGAYCILPIREKRQSTVILSNNMQLNSSILAKMLSDCHQIVFIAVTAQGSQEYLDALSQKSVSQAMLASQSLDKAVNDSIAFLMGFLSSKYRKQADTLLKKRLGPGLGDFDLHYQKTIFDLLELDQLSMQINEGYMLTPVKSSITVTGIRRMQ